MSTATRRANGLIALSLLSVLGCPNPEKDAEATGDTSAPDSTAPGDPEALCQISVQCPGDILNDPKAPCTMQIVGGGGASIYDGPAGLELRGRSSLTFPKPQYAVELRQYTELPVWPGSPWKYLDGGENPGANWNKPNFNDTSWATGPAPLGYGEDYLQTEVSSEDGPNGTSVTTYFRHAFNVGSRASITNVDLGLLRDDGAAVYLNGTEILRDNLPPEAAIDTPAIAETLDAAAIAWVEIDVDPALLVDGTNVLAVEVHQDSVDSDDMRFDLYLEATGEDQPTDVLGMGSDSDWILNGQYVDRSLFRNRLLYDLYQSLGGADRYATETRFCELELDGDYRGIYTLGEKIEREEGRVDIGKADVDGESFIIKLDDEYGFHDNAVGYGEWQMEYPDLDEGSAAVVSEYLTGWEQAILGSDPAAIFDWVDLDSAVDWVLLQEFAKNQDAYRLSVHLWKDEGGKMFFSPWDLDLSMGYPYTDCGATGWNPRDFLRDGQVQSIDFIRAMAAAPAFEERLVSRWAEMREGSFSDEAVLERIAGYDETLAPAIEANFARWPIEDIAFATDYPVVEDNWLCPVDSYEDEHTRTLSFVTERLAWMDANIESF